MPVQNPPTVLYGQSSSNDLWRKAVSTLDAELRDSFDFANARHGKVLLEALKQLQQKKRPLHTTVLDVQETEW